MITQQIFQGFFDTDGTIQVTLKKTNKTKQRFRCSILFTFTQSIANKHMLEQLQKEYGGPLFGKTRKTGTKEIVYKNYITSKAGQKMLVCLKNYAPLNPNKRHDFLIANHVANCLKKKVHYTSKNQIYLIYLIYGMSNQLKKSLIIKRKPIQYWLDLFNEDQSTLLFIKRKSEIFMKFFVQLQTSKLIKSLPTTVLNNDYMRGAHFGDGSLTVFLCWNPKQQFITRPCWSITDSNKHYLEAFLFTFKKGRIKRVGPAKTKCYQYVIENVKPCLECVIPLFNSKWLPKYKKQQFYKFKQACYMLKCNFLYKEKEAKMFLNIVYSMSENSKRKYSKEQFEKWIVQKLKSRRALKPNFKLYKKLINLQLQFTES